MASKPMIAAMLVLAAGCGGAADEVADLTSEQVGSAFNVYFAGVPFQEGATVVMKPGERREFELTARHPTVSAMMPDAEEARRIATTDYRNPAPAIVFPWFLTHEDHDANTKPNPNYAAAFYVPSEADPEVPSADRLTVRGVIVAPDQTGDYKVRIYYLPTPKRLGGSGAAAPKINEDGSLRADWLVEFPVRVEGRTAVRN